jgi:RNA polymerase sigma factor (TIGR02999 family)
MAQEKLGQTLQATALVHEAYVRLLGDGDDGRWQNRRHFFAAAAEAMRRILVEVARRKGRERHGGGRIRRDVEPIEIAGSETPAELIDVHEVLDLLEAVRPDAAQIVKLRYFAGFTNREAADILGVSARKANQLWSYARAWLLDALGAE